MVDGWETPHPMVQSAKFNAEREAQIYLELEAQLKSETFQTD